MKDAGVTMKLSPDGTKLLVGIKLGINKSASDKFLFEFRLMVFDSEINLMWESDVTLTHPHGRFDLPTMTYSYFTSAKGFEIGNSGDVFCTGKIDSGRKFSGKSRYQLKLFRINAEGISSTSALKASFNGEQYLLAALFARLE